MIYTLKNSLICLKLRLLDCFLVWKECEMAECEGFYGVERGVWSVFLGIRERGEGCEGIERGADCGGGCVGGESGKIVLYGVKLHSNSTNL